MLLGLIAMAWIVFGATKLLGRLSGYSSIGLGMLNPDFNLLWSVHARRDPGLVANLQRERYTFRELTRRSSGLLLHSRLYTSPQAIRRIAAWMDACR